MEDNPEWKQLEILVANIQKELAPDAEVTHNVKVKGLVTGEPRQIDVLVRQRIGQYEMIVAIDCKDYKTAVDVKGVEEFHGLIRDIGAHKGALVCPRGFSATAKKRAKSYGIDIYSPVDTDPHKWQVKVAIPMICDFRSATIAFGITCSEPMPFRMDYEFYKTMEVFDGQGNALGTPLAAGINRWNSGEFPTDPGSHDRVLIFPDCVTMVDNGYGQRIKVTLHASIMVTQRLYFGHLPIKKIRGLKDEHTGAVVTNAFTTDVLSPEQVEGGWKRLAENEEPPTNPAMKIVGLDCWEVSGQ